MKKSPIRKRPNQKANRKKSIKTQKICDPDGLFSFNEVYAYELAVSENLKEYQAIYDRDNP